jgi:hypothetical protein
MSITIPQEAGLKLVLSKQQILESWQWLLENISDRPFLQDGLDFIDDHKQWGDDPGVPLLTDDIFVEHVARLLIVSQLGDISQINDMARGIEPKDLYSLSDTLDEDVRTVINSDKRFRHGLSEHLGFWVSLATIVNLDRFNAFAISQPNFQPEDKGPDGLFMGVDLDDESYIELRSIKSSVGNPYYLVATADFRNGGDADKSKQLEEYYLLTNKNYGFTRLDRLLAQVCSLMDIRIDQLAGCRRESFFYWLSGLSG